MCSYVLICVCSAIVRFTRPSRDGYLGNEQQLQSLSRTALEDCANQGRWIRWQTQAAVRRYLKRSLRGGLKKILSHLSHPSRRTICPVAPTSAVINVLRGGYAAKPVAQCYTHVSNIYMLEAAAGGGVITPPIQQIKARPSCWYIRRSSALQMWGEPILRSSSYLDWSCGSMQTLLTVSTSDLSLQRSPEGSIYSTAPFTLYKCGCTHTGTSYPKHSNDDTIIPDTLERLLSVIHAITSILKASRTKTGTSADFLRNPTPSSNTTAESGPLSRWMSGGASALELALGLTCQSSDECVSKFQKRPCLRKSKCVHSQKSVSQAFKEKTNK